MRVALCFSGLPRFVEETFSYWKHSLLDPYQPDVFVHTWSEPGTVDYNNLSRTLSTLYQPRVLTIQAPEKFDVSIYRDRIWPHRTTPSNQVSQYTSIKRSLELRRLWETHNQFEYDIVVRARFDWYLKEVDLEVNNEINVAHTPTLSRHQFQFQGQPYVGISDQFAYGSSENMTVYSQLVDNMPQLYQDYGIDFCGELLLKGHLLYHQLGVKEHRWTNGMVRSDGIMP